MDRKATSVSHKGDPTISTPKETIPNDAELDDDNKSKIESDLKMMESKRMSPIDPSSYARPDMVKTIYVKLRLQVDFDGESFDGEVDLTVHKKSSTTNNLILDVKNLYIKSISDHTTKAELPYEIAEGNEDFGSRLTVTLAKSESNECVITIKYETSPFASGLQWLGPLQTCGKRYPYVFSQFEITVPKEMTVVMSAIRTDRSPAKNTNNVTYKFEQKIPIPAYLIAIAIGVIDNRSIGPRSTVWAESEIIDDAAKEFSGTEAQLHAAEEICGPYVWGTYDLLVLPASFPYGGMENPNVSFITPTAVAGDRSLTNIIAHEISHSWSGNLVSFVSFEHIWLSESFSLFLERKIVGRLHGKPLQDYNASAGTTDMEEALNRWGMTNALTCLVPDLSGIHPDDAASAVIAEKGHLFLRELERIVGGPDVFEPFLRKYFDAFKFQSISTNDFRRFYEKEFPRSSFKPVPWNRWLHRPGMPPTMPVYDLTISKAGDTMVQRWLSWDVTSDCPFSEAEFDPHVMILFLQRLLKEEPQPIAKLEKFEQTMHFSRAKNSEIKFRWLRLGIRSHWQKILPPTIGWVNEIGRMKYTRQLYRDMYDWEFAREYATNNFDGHRDQMMHVVACSIQQDLHLA